MDSINAYDSSDGEDVHDPKVTDLSPSESANIVSELQGRFPLNSAPYVPVKVDIN